MSLAMASPNVISVGASGALMGLFAALFISSFRLTAGTSQRHALQFNSLRVLVPSLLPLFSTGSVLHIDYGAHFGGAIAGAAVALPLLKFWPEAVRIPQLRRLAATIAIVGGLLFVVSVGMVTISYSQHDVALIPQAEIPRTQAEITERATALVQKYPNDPRSHFYLGQALAAANDSAGAERELRLASAKATAHIAVLGARAELVFRGTLAVFLSEQGKRDEARNLARGMCAALADDKSAATLVKALAAENLCN